MGMNKKLRVIGTGTANTETSNWRQVMGHNPKNYHYGAKVVLSMKVLNFDIYEHLDLLSTLDLDQRFNYLDSILKGTTCKKFKSVVPRCK